MGIEQLALATGIIFFAYLVRGITGFGSSLVAVPLLAHFLPLPFVVAFMLVLDFTASLVLGRSTRRDIRWDELKPLLPFSAIGVVVGVVLLIKVPREPLLVTLGTLVLAFGVRTLFNVHGEKAISRAWAAPAGFAGGAVSALFAAGGPPYVVYLTHRLRDKSQLRATFSGLFMLEGGLRVMVFIAAGLLSDQTLFRALAIALPVMALGLYAGHRAHLGISNAQMLRFIGLLLIGAGGSLVWHALG